MGDMVVESGTAAPCDEQSAPDDCPQCGTGPETYTMLRGMYKFDVDLARSIVSDGREPLALDIEDVKYALEWSVIHEPHLDHVDLTYPGIIAHYWYPDTSGELLHGTVLIDGHHRAAKALQRNVPFYVVVLTEAESKKVTLRSPEVGVAME